MKQLSEYINEKLVLNKDTFKNNYKYFPKTTKELRKILERLIRERGKDANLNDIDVSNIDYMGRIGKNNNYGLFEGLGIHNIDISKWDVSKVKDMSLMFFGCVNLISIGDISNWNVSNVTDMYGMFYCCQIKNIDISNWNVSNVTDMSHMFNGCKKLESIGDISNWKTSKVKNMRSMLRQCENLKFVGDLSNWDVSNVENMLCMFKDSGITNIPSWYDA